MTPHTDFPDTWFVMSSTLLRQVLRTSLLYPSCYGLRPNRALSCEPQRLRGPPEAAKLRFQTLPEVAWNALWLVSCSALLNSIRLRRIAEGTVARVCPPLPARDVTTHPVLGGASRPERGRHDATSATHARGPAAARVLAAHPGSVRPRGPPTGCSFSPGPRPTGGGAAA